jgi:hypothetical protein
LTNFRTDDINEQSDGAKAQETQMNETLIQATEVSPYLRDRVIDVLSNGATSENLRIASSGVGLESYLKSYGLDPTLAVAYIDLIRDNETEANEVADYITTNRWHFAQVALDIYWSDQDFWGKFFSETDTVPDATGNSTSRCDLCGGLH